LLSWNNGRYCQTILLGRNNIPIIQSNPAYDIPYSTTTKPWSNQIIKSYNTYIPEETIDKQYPSMEPSTINHNVNDQPILKEECNTSEEIII
jgi:hypothetical protein